MNQFIYNYTAELLKTRFPGKRTNNSVEMTVTADGKIQAGPVLRRNKKGGETYNYITIKFRPLH